MNLIDERPEPFFIAGAPGVDFLNSIATPVDVPVDWLSSGEDLLAWLIQAELIPKRVADEFRRAFPPAELDSVAAQARALREWFRGFVRKHRGKPLGRNIVRELEPLNQLLARDEQYEEIAGEPLRLERRRRWRRPDALLFPIASSLADVICAENFEDIKACEGSVCTLFYVDRTRGRTRRWCSMAVCGNRSKQATHRVRKVRQH